MFASCKGKFVCVCVYFKERERGGGDIKKEYLDLVSLSNWGLHIEIYEEHFNNVTLLTI